MVKKLSNFLLRIRPILGIDILSTFHNYDTSSDKVLWIYQNHSMRHIFWYMFKSNTMLHDIALLNSLNATNQKFRIAFGKDLPGDNFKYIFYTMSKLFERDGMSYTESIQTVVEGLDNQGITPVPSLQEVRLWENKEWMHKEFNRLRIRHPLSFVVSDESQTSALSFPFLIKEVHSCGGKGVIKVDNALELNRYWKNKKNDDPVIYQELLRMRKDLRVILVENEIFIHYWRLNNSSEWRVTSTSQGSKVDFVSFPELWRSKIIEEFKKFNVSTGAFDIAWQDDDLTTEPYFLEFSTHYMPNPRPQGRYSELPYNQYKRTVFGPDAYYKKYLWLINEIKIILVKRPLINDKTKN